MYLTYYFSLVYLLSVYLPFYFFSIFLYILACYFHVLSHCPLLDIFLLFFCISSLFLNERPCAAYYFIVVIYPFPMHFHLPLYRPLFFLSSLFYIQCCTFFFHFLHFSFCTFIYLVTLIASFLLFHVLYWIAIFFPLFLSRSQDFFFLLPLFLYKLSAFAYMMTYHRVTPPSPFRIYII